MFRIKMFHKHDLSVFEIPIQVIESNMAMVVCAWVDYDGLCLVIGCVMRM